MLHSTLRKSISAAVALVLLVTLAAVAGADTLTASSGSVTVAAGSSTTVDFTVVADRIEPFKHSNCDLQGGAMQIMVDFTSSDTSLATVSPASHLFTNCGEAFTVTVNGIAPGGVTVTAQADYADPDSKLADPTHEGANPEFGIRNGVASVTVTDGGGGGDDVGPSVSYLLTPSAPNGLASWYTVPVAVDWTTGGDPTPTLTGDCTDTTYSVDGEYSLTCVATNTVGSAQATATFKIDQTDPTDIAFVGGPADGATEELGAVPTAPTCTATDATSGLNSCVVTGYSSDVGSHTLTATATDNAGNDATLTRSYTVADTTDPVVDVILDLAAPDGENDWYVSDVDVTMDSTDLATIVREELNIDGAGLTAYTGAVTVSADGNHTAYGEAEDASGNVGDDTETFKIDQTDPVVTVVGAGDSYATGSGPTCNTTDVTSGVQNQATPTYTAPSGGTGLGTWSVSCGGGEDNAGNIADAVVSNFEVTSYGTDGGVREPIDPRRDVMKLFSRGKSIPVKFGLLGDEPTGFATTNFRATKVPVSCAMGSKTPIGAAVALKDMQTGTGVFRYSAAADQYVLNGDFRKDAVGSCWYVDVDVDLGGGQHLPPSATIKLTK